MKLYLRLAWEGIRKNKRLYVPYIMACSCVIMLFYLIHHLAAMPELTNMPGGTTTSVMLGMGVWIIILFAFIFLVYTNSFLMRRRRKEFGLYNMLGMGKRNLGVVLACETTVIFLFSIAAGMFGGILFSKLAELGLTWTLGGVQTYEFTVNADVVRDTFLVFIPIFAVIFAKSLLQIGHMSAVSMLKSENTGEKPPKANYLFGIGGIVLLAGAYYISLSITDPLNALMNFFIAVGMVVAATYLLFISGSVMMCRLLQKNKRYYYKKNHFVSVSSMVFRMKRNGAGLASICILCTMVMVMLLGSGSLFFGAADMLNARYPRDINISVYYSNEEPSSGYSVEKTENITADLDEFIKAKNISPENKAVFSSLAPVGLIKNGAVIFDPYTVNTEEFNDFSYISYFRFVPLADYNRCMGENVTLESGEAMIYCVRTSFDEDVLKLQNGTSWQIVKRVQNFVGEGSAYAAVIPTVYVFVPDISAAIDAVNYEFSNADYFADTRVCLNYGFDTDLSAAEEIKFYRSVKEYLKLKERAETCDFYYSDIESKENARAEFSGLSSGIFFVAVFLSVVFMLAAVLIIYYKQITEGYEDRERFTIMQKVGMTKRDIHKSINSQILTVFFLPLITAAMHLCFCFPIMQKLLLLFNLNNNRLSLDVMGGTVLVFAVIYSLIYKLTSNAYYSIVSENSKT